MFAVIRTGGKQYRVQVGDVLEIEKLGREEGQQVMFDQVLLIEDDKQTLIGTPVIENARVVGEVLANLKDEKVLVFKKKRRKQHKKMRGHRQELTRVKIGEILSGTEVSAGRSASPKPPVEKKPEKKAPAPRKPSSKTAAARKKASEKKKAPAKASPEKPSTEEKAEVVRKTGRKKDSGVEGAAGKKTTSRAKSKPPKKE